MIVTHESILALKKLSLEDAVIRIIDILSSQHVQGVDLLIQSGFIEEIMPTIENTLIKHKLIKAILLSDNSALIDSALIKNIVREIQSYLHGDTFHKTWEAVQEVLSSKSTLAKNIALNEILKHFVTCDDKSLIQVVRQVLALQYQSFEQVRLVLAGLDMRWQEKQDKDEAFEAAIIEAYQRLFQDIRLMPKDLRSSATNLLKLEVASDTKEFAKKFIEEFIQQLESLCAIEDYVEKRYGHIDQAFANYVSCRQPGFQSTTASTRSQPASFSASFANYSRDQLATNQRSSAYQGQFWSESVAGSNSHTHANQPGSKGKKSLPKVNNDSVVAAKKNRPNF